jgi:hypothetical protein
MRQFNKLLEEVRGNQNKQYSNEVEDVAQGIDEGEPQERP